MSFDPPTVIFSAHELVGIGRKDTVNNIEETGVFCWQLATYTLREAVNMSAEAVGPSVDEFDRAKLEKTWSQSLATPVPMVAASPVRFECEYLQTIRLPGSPPMGTVDLIIGRVVGVYIDDSVLTNGRIDVRKAMPIARLGYYEYAVVKDSFDMIIPGEERTLVGVSTEWAVGHPDSPLTDSLQLAGERSQSQPNKESIEKNDGKETAELG